MLPSDISEIAARLPVSVVDALAGKHVLLPGGRGFLGRYFTAVFVELNRTRLTGREVRATTIDNHASSGARGRAEADDGFAHVNVTSLNLGSSTFSASMEKFDYVLYLAGIASPAHYRALPLETIDAATTGLRLALELAKEHGARLLFFSSSEIYGDPDSEHVPTAETYRGNVSCLGPRACYSSDTQVMTREGWKLFEELTIHDEIASLSETHRIIYVKPTEVVRQAFIGNMYHFVNEKMDLLVTPNHLMIDERRGRQFVEAQADVEWSHRTAPVGGCWPDFDANEKWVLPPPSRNAKVTHPDVPMSAWLEFVGIYLSEGCVTLTPRKNVVNGKLYEGEQFRVLLAHDHGWKREKILACLQRLPWKFHELDHQFQICNKQLVEALLPFGKKSIEKCVPREYLDLPPSALRVLFEGMMMDGSRDGSAFHTSSESLANAAQEIAIKVGRAASIARFTRDDNPYSDREQFRVNLRPPVNAHYPEPERVAYTGDVWCVDLPPYRTLLVRRNGKAVFGSNCYDESKRLGETLVKIYSDRGVSASIVRPFNVYGPGMQHTDARVLPNFAARMAKGEALQVYGDGRQTRTYCYVTDAIDGFLRALVLGRPGEPYNIGNPRPEVSVLELADEVHRIAGLLAQIKGIEVLPHPASYPADEPSRRCPNIGKASRDLGYEPRVELADGLRRFFDWALATYPRE